MRQMFLLVGALCSAMLFAEGVSAVEYQWTGNGFVEVGSAPSSFKQAVTIPPGFHAHTRTDGSTFIHGDENYGKAAPHAGVERPWPKTGLPGQTMLVDSSELLTASPCPGGVCPPGGGRRVIYSSTDTVQTSHVESHGERRGIFKRIADNVRERRSARQSRRGGGCP